MQNSKKYNLNEIKNWLKTQKDEYGICIHAILRSNLTHDNIQKANEIQDENKTELKL